MNTSRYCCPVCRQPLRLKSTPNGFVLYCGYGPCRSKVSNDGAFGLSEQAAFEALLENIDKEES